MAKSNKSKYAILGMLAAVPRSSGYDIKHLMEHSTQFFWKESFSSIYPVLAALVKDGLIEEIEDNSKSERQKNVYELTAKGKKELKEWLGKPVEYEQLRNELLLKLFYGEFAPVSTTRKHVEDFYQMLLKRSDIFQSIKERMIRENKNDAGFPYWMMTLDYGIIQVNGAIEWSKKTLKQYEQLET